MARFDERELDVVDRQWLARAVVEVLERGDGDPRGMPAHGDPVATACNDHIERLFDLTQVFVERAAEIREPRIVVLRGGEFQVRDRFLQPGRA